MYLNVEKVQLQPPLANSMAFATVLTIWGRLIAFQMSFSACEATCAHSAWLCHSRGWRSSGIRFEDRSRHGLGYLVSDDHNLVVGCGHIECPSGLRLKLHNFG